MEKHDKTANGWKRTTKNWCLNHPQDQFLRYLTSHHPRLQVYDPSTNIHPSPVQNSSQQFPNPLKGNTGQTRLSCNRFFSRYTAACANFIVAWNHRMHIMRSHTIHLKMIVTIDSIIIFKSIFSKSFSKASSKVWMCNCAMIHPAHEVLNEKTNGKKEFDVTI